VFLNCCGSVLIGFSVYLISALLVLAVDMVGYGVNAVCPRLTISVNLVRSSAISEPRSLPEQ
jgi:hypothetical protein